MLLLLLPAKTERFGSPNDVIKNIRGRLSKGGSRHPHVLRLPCGP